MPEEGLAQWSPACRPASLSLLWSFFLTGPRLCSTSGHAQCCVLMSLAQSPRDGVCIACGRPCPVQALRVRWNARSSPGPGPEAVRAPEEKRAHRWLPRNARLFSALLFPKNLSGDTREQIEGKSRADPRLQELRGCTEPWRTRTVDASLLNAGVPCSPSVLRSAPSDCGRTMISGRACEEAARSPICLRTGGAVEGVVGSETASSGHKPECMRVGFRQPGDTLKGGEERRIWADPLAKRKGEYLGEKGPSSTETHTRGSPEEHAQLGERDCLCAAKRAAALRTPGNGTKEPFKGVNSGKRAPLARLLLRGARTLRRPWQPGSKVVSGPNGAEGWYSEWCPGKKLLSRAQRRQGGAEEVAPGRSLARPVPRSLQRKRGPVSCASQLLTTTCRACLRIKADTFPSVLSPTPPPAGEHAGRSRAGRRSCAETQAQNQALQSLHPRAPKSAWPPRSLFREQTALKTTSAVSGLRDPAWYEPTACSRQRQELFTQKKRLWITLTVLEFHKLS